MKHDFDRSHGGTGNPGTGPCATNGIMGYKTDGNNRNQLWSTCSRSDFERHYAAENWENCLEDISGWKLVIVLFYGKLFSSFTC